MYRSWSSIDRSALNRLILSSSSRSDCRLLILDMSENKIFTGKSILLVSPVFFGFDFYDRGRVMVIDQSNPAAALNLEFFREDDRKVPESVIDSYSIGSWLKDILIRL